MACTYIMYWSLAVLRLTGFLMPDKKSCCVLKLSSVDLCVYALLLIELSGQKSLPRLSLSSATPFVIYTERKLEGCRLSITLRNLKSR